jgi:hypothetical protein
MNVKSLQEQRKQRRYDLRLPIEVISMGSHTVRSVTETRNLSSCGVLFFSEAEVPIGEQIEYTITLPGRQEEDPVRIRCMGKVVRSEERAPAGDSQPQYSVAATMERYEFVRNAS